MERAFEIDIKTTPERLWTAITDTEMRRKYNFGAVLTSQSTPGSGYRGMGGGRPIFEGENLSIDAPCRLIVTHDQLRENANAQLCGGWPMVRSGLKTLLETGELLTTPGSLRWQHGREATA
jgi:uncharacterized protein YndB with AHSA1/START domain